MFQHAGRRKSIPWKRLGTSKIIAETLTSIPAVVMFLLTALVLQTDVRIEVLNFQAGSYLPRKDRNPDGTLADGKWRVSLENSPRDQLRALVGTYGLLQYLLARSC